MDRLFISGRGRGVRFRRMESELNVGKGGENFWGE